MESTRAAPPSPQRRRAQAGASGGGGGAAGAAGSGTGAGTGGNVPGLSTAAVAAHADIDAIGRPPAGGGRKCKCRQTQCLKLYCECFANSAYCDPSCSCTDCSNTEAGEERRLAAIKTVLERNPNAFRPKVAADASERPADGPVTKHSRGCYCRKSGCLKKYCECYQAGVECSDRCGCVDCKNVHGNPERSSLFDGYLDYGDENMDDGPGSTTTSAPGSPTKRARTAAAAAVASSLPAGRSGTPPPAQLLGDDRITSPPASPLKRVGTGGGAGGPAPGPAAAGAKPGQRASAVPLPSRREADEALERHLYTSMLQHEKLLRLTEVLVVAAQEAERAVLARAPEPGNAGGPATPSAAAALQCDEPDALASPTTEHSQLTSLVDAPQPPSVVTSDLYIRQERAVLEGALDCLQQVMAAVDERRTRYRQHDTVTPTGPVRTASAAGNPAVYTATVSPTDSSVYDLLVSMAQREQ